MESCGSGFRARCCVAPWAVRSRALLEHAGSRRGSSESFAFSFGLGVASKLSGMMPQQQYAQQPQMMQTQRPTAEASTRTVVETEEGFSFDVAFWEGAIRFGGAEIICGELSRIESQCVVHVVFCFRPAPSWDCRGKEYSEQAAATACLLTVAVTHRRAVWPDLRRHLSQVFRQHVSPTRVVSFHFDFWERGSLLLSTLLMMMTAALAMLTYDDDHDKDEAADDEIIMMMRTSFSFSFVLLLLFLLHCPLD